MGERGEEGGWERGGGRGEVGVRMRGGRRGGRGEEGKRGGGRGEVGKGGGREVGEGSWDKGEIKMIYTTCPTYGKSYWSGLLQLEGWLCTCGRGKQT